MNVSELKTNHLNSIDGNVGIGISEPQAKLHVVGGGNSSVKFASARLYFFGGSEGLVGNNGIYEWEFNRTGIYASSSILTSGYLVSIRTSSYSDIRIKDNIVDVDDDSCLQKLRLLKPKKYTYKDTLQRGIEPVWGFIAQEVAETLEYSVEKIEKVIPNIYKLASVSEDGYVLTFDEPISLEVGKIQLKTLIKEEYDVIISEIISPTSVRLTKPLSEEHHTGTLDEDLIVNKVFVYGQIINDFHILDKNAIFTVAVAALQEVDRRQVADNERILELENENATLQSEVNTLKQQMAMVMERLGL